MLRRGLNGPLFYEKRLLMKKYLLGALGIILAVPLCFFLMVMREKHTNPVIIYLENKFHHPHRDFLLEAFKEIPNASFKQTALMLGADVGEKDSLLPLQKGYSLMAVDERMIYYEFMIPQYATYKDQITVLPKLDLEVLPELDLVMASFIFPFYTPEKFRETWQAIDEKMNSGGCFVGNFFDPDFEIFSSDERRDMSFHTKAQVMDLLEHYKILRFEEVKKFSEVQKGYEHYYEVLAVKN